MTRFKALSVKQPWANLICAGTKTIETRKWATNYRGPLLICASKTVDIPAQVQLVNMGHKFIPPFARGVAVCLVDLVGCRAMTAEDEDAACCDVCHGAFAWDLANVRRLKAPLPAVKGQLGLYKVELERLVLE